MKDTSSYPSIGQFKHKPHLHETVIRYALFLCAGISILTTIGIVFELSKESILFFSNYAEPGSNPFEFFKDTADGEGVTILEFLTGTVWQPMNGKFGMLPLLNATLMTSFIAMLIAAPLGIFVAIYLSEYASSRVRNILKPILEILAGIPTVVYGYFALTFMTPILRFIWGSEIVEIYNTASAGIVMGILILPLVSSMTEDALSSVPNSLRHGAMALGATRLQATIAIVVPAAFSGIAASFILGLSRAIGETMIVALAAGSGPNFTFNPFKAAETLTGYIVRISGGDIGYNTPDYNSIFALGLVLFLMTLVLNIISRKIVRRFREVYE